MNTGEFIQEYNNIVEKALRMSDISRREGLLALEELLDEDKFIKRDLFEVGLLLVTDRNDNEFIDKILSNLVNLETDNDKRLLKTIEKEAVLAINAGWDPRLLELLLNSYVNIEVEKTMKHFCGG
jgi:flagellar motor component MotA